MNKGRWTLDEEVYVKENLGKISIKVMSENLGKSELAVKLYVHRKQLYMPSSLKRNVIIEILKLKFIHPENFAPTRAFYKEVKINQIRWWSLYRGKSSVTQQEYISLTNYFGITLEEAMNTRQLNLFEE